MKIKCNDYGPITEGIYETDIGLLVYKIHGLNLHMWYQMTESDNIKSYVPVIPNWWNDKNISL